MTVNILTQSRLKEILHYNPETGDFIWKESHGKCTKGRIAGGLTSQGYWRIGIDKTRYRGHLLAWLYMYGHMPKHPKEQIDHINQNRSDNRIVNIRLLSSDFCQTAHEKNSRNYSQRSDNTSGCTGVCLCKESNKWHAKIYVNKKPKSLGRHENIADAIKARKEAEVEYGYHENHGNKKGPPKKPLL